ncbi:MAG: lipoprotein-releasing system permease protein [Clostridiales bacterium]|jgi:lipoprotein-releasing system permease protein|nr:lipoprotein-releasing system permease protein [Clostridiales bacterium]
MSGLSFRIAWRFLKSSRGQTILILLGITIGVSVQIFIGSLIDGLQRSLVDNTIGRSSHITVEPAGSARYFERDDDLIIQLTADEQADKLAVSYSNSGFMVYEDETWPLLFRGFEFDQADSIYRFSESLVEGDMPANSSEILLGSALAAETGIEPGDMITAINPEGKSSELTVSGIFDLQVSSINESWAISDLIAVQELFSADNQLSSIEIQIEDVFSADTIAAGWSGLLSEEQKITNWKDQNASLLSGLSGQSASSYMIQVFVLLAVLLGISSVLAISVVQKSRQLGILKAMGIKDKAASWIFLAQGLILGTVGSIIGTGLGLLLNWSFSVFVKNPDGSSLVPFYFDPVFVFVSMFIAIIAATLAAFIPARKSSKLNPIEVIKNG